MLSIIEKKMSMNIPSEAHDAHFHWSNTASSLFKATN